MADAVSLGRVREAATDLSPVDVPDSPAVERSPGTGTGEIRGHALAPAWLSPSVLGDWGAPPDVGAKLACVLAVALGALALRTRAPFPHLTSPRQRIVWVMLAAVAAALLSFAYVAVYLRGGPRIVDATTYYLQARGLAKGLLAWPLLEPTASFRGRFLVYRPETHLVAGIFPPGFPLVLALGFLVRAPMAVGPCVAAALVLATYRLTRTLADDDPRAIPIARLAALLSVASSALRYHTADTMSHGVTALAVTLALECALRAAARVSGWAAFGAGLAVGFVCLARPVTGLPIGAVTFYCIVRARRGAMLRAATIAGVVPGLVVLAAAEYAATGRLFTSAQALYYAASDGPEGCFGWGFGRAGCLHEHGEFVRDRLARGHGLVEAALATARRLRLHALDVANFEPLALLVLAPRPRAHVRMALALVALQCAAYAPFYFDGNYPGGGARFFADVLPVEHALLALGLARVAGDAFSRASLLTLAASLGGFAVHAVFGHRALADRDGGRPMFERARLGDARRGLVFVDTDHGFALGHDPLTDADTGLVVARRRDDARDRMLYERLGRPPTYRYDFHYAPGTSAAPLVSPWVPPEIVSAARLEAEAEWPALSQRGGFAAPVWTSSCASARRALVLTPDRDSAEAIIELPVVTTGRYRVTPHVVRGARAPFTRVDGPGPRGRGRVEIGGRAWEWTDAPDGCGALEADEVSLIAPSVTVRVMASGGPVAVDALDVVPVELPSVRGRGER